MDILVLSLVAGLVVAGGVWIATRDTKPPGYNVDEGPLSTPLAIDAGLVQRIRSLVGGIEVDLDAELDAPARDIPAASDILVRALRKPNPPEV